MRITKNEKRVTEFRIATNDGRGTQWHNIVTWEKLAEICSLYLRKGRQVYVEGRIETRDWQGKDGVKRRTVEIIAEEVVFLSPKNLDRAPEDIIKEQQEGEELLKKEDWDDPPPF